MTLDSAEKRIWLDTMWLPKRPHATDSFERGVWRHDRASAMGRRIVEANPPALRNILTVDLDHDDSLFRAAEVAHPRPNLIIENPVNGHAHAAWVLGAPVATTDVAKAGPLRYVAAVSEGLRRKVGGDPGYTGLLMKNPLHSGWNAQPVRMDHLYTLAELDRELGKSMPGRYWYRQRPAIERAGLGRNCTLFEVARRWAYRQVRHLAPDQAAFERAVLDYVEVRNMEFGVPLPASEVRAIGRSITRWVLRSDNWNRTAEERDAYLSELQAHRGRLSAQARRDRNADRDENIWIAHTQGLSTRQIGDLLGVSHMTVARVIKAQAQTRDI